MISSGQAGSLPPFTITVYYTMNGTAAQTDDRKNTGFSTGKLQPDGL